MRARERERERDQVVDPALDCGWSLLSHGAAEIKGFDLPLVSSTGALHFSTESKVAWSIPISARVQMPPLVVDSSSFKIRFRITPPPGANLAG